MRSIQASEKHILLIADTLAEPTLRFHEAGSWQVRSTLPMPWTTLPIASRIGPERARSRAQQHPMRQPRDIGRPIVLLGVAAPEDGRAPPPKKILLHVLLRCPRVSWRHENDDPDGDDRDT